jgi:Leucine rich repeat
MMSPGHFLLFFSFILLTNIVDASVGEFLTVECDDKIRTYDQDLRRYYDECKMKRTIIDSKAYKISESEKSPSETGLIFTENKNIHFLPTAIYETFPKLLRLNADECSIRRISRDNFGKLTYLKFLFLAGNKINAIPSDTFEDLKALRILTLGKFVLKISDNDLNNLSN